MIVLGALLLWFLVACVCGVVLGRSIRTADLRTADLRTADLRTADLRSADIPGTTARPVAGRPVLAGAASARD
ncbi:hypothetical protein OF117_17410 [Geodermatophilus sp. YIM 151500]|uniref:hypothetical protein n=1 Tax=Geodermatophilus sp. YIM 151500 TaxID=2984531 RepID=UPI0021E3FAB5|nr:hypothetical protein [Geodermatophilus sp. YIM 151500]MCV2491130.1 hypothetical protein [Geodermatophilus sp. YIM 151500]